jgi:hypothetical protein
VGMDNMGEDLIPMDEQGLSQKTTVATFKENPEICCNLKKASKFEKRKKFTSTSRKENN